MVSALCVHLACILLYCWFDLDLKCSRHHAFAMLIIWRHAVAVTCIVQYRSYVLRFRFLYENFVSSFKFDFVQVQFKFAFRIRSLISLIAYHQDGSLQLLFLRSWDPRALYVLKSCTVCSFARLFAKFASARRERSDLFDLQSSFHLLLLV